MINIPKPDQYPKLTPEEEALSMAKYYHRPMIPLNPVFETALKAAVLTPAKIPTPEDWVELVCSGTYNESDFGYGMMENGAGYLALYTVTRHVPEMKQWWLKWMRVRPAKLRDDCGNICYKLWCPPDHYDQRENKGTESLDLGQGDPKEEIYSYPLDLVEMGMPQEKAEALKAAGVNVRIGYEKFDHPGTHITFRYSRPCPTGGFEEISREWIGYSVKDGRFVRDEETPVSEEYLRKIVIHNALEHFRLEAMLPELYAEYGHKPLDAD